MAPWLCEYLSRPVPEAITKLPGGYMGVQYAMLGLTLKTVH